MWWWKKERKEEICYRKAHSTSFIHIKHEYWERLILEHSLPNTSVFCTSVSLYSGKFMTTILASVQERLTSIVNVMVVSKELMSSNWFMLTCVNIGVSQSCNSGGLLLSVMIVLQKFSSEWSSQLYLLLHRSEMSMQQPKNGFLKKIACFMLT